MLVALQNKLQHLWTQVFCFFPKETNAPPSSFPRACHTKAHMSAVFRGQIRLQGCSSNLWESPGLSGQLQGFGPVLRSAGVSGSAPLWPKGCLFDYTQLRSLQPWGWPLPRPEVGRRKPFLLSAIQRAGWVFGFLAVLRIWCHPLTPPKRARQCGL